MGIELNKQQLAAVTHDGGHVLVLAGAGTGKTRTIIERTAHLVREGVDPKRILLLTFTRRAAREMNDRLLIMLDTRANKITAGTFHYFCLMTMRKLPRQFGIESATVIDRDDQQQLMKIIRAPFLQKGEALLKASQLVDLYSYARNTNQSASAYLEKYTELNEDDIIKVCMIFKGYEERKRANGYLDYDDILFQFAKKLHESAATRDQLRKKYDHILVDEMQDTNPLQWLILDALRDPAQLFCVGDDAQSIYAFRGADFRNVHSFTERVPGAKILKLEENYRSTQEILDLSNWLLHESPLSYDKELTSHRGPGFMPVLREFENEFEEANWITKDLVERHRDGQRWDDHMVICRTGFATRAVEAAMVEKQIPYRFIGGTGLLQASHVKDMFAMIRAGTSHRDELAWARFLTLWPKIGDVTAAKLIHKFHDLETFNEAMEIVNKELENRPEILDGIEIVLKHWQDPERTVRECSRYLDKLLQNKYTNWRSRRRDFDILERLASKFRSLISFLETYTLDPISSSEADHVDEDDLVTLITVHSAKGTEAPVCYLMRAEAGMYPHVRTKGDTDEVEEDRRVLYVAMTRAENELILTRTHAPEGRSMYFRSFTDRYTEDGPAYFLEDVPSCLIEEINPKRRYEDDDLDDFCVIRPFG